jgi:Ca2+-binding EF-hand superfamily protein
MDKVKEFAAESNMRYVNAAKASKKFKLYMDKTDNKPLDKSEFVEFMIEMMKGYDFCDTKTEEDDMRDGFDGVFDLFDYDKSGTLDSEEVANCLAMMCGGSINEKIFAAFKLFDTNNSMTLSFDELNRFVKCVFQIFGSIKQGVSHKGTVW